MDPFRYKDLQIGFTEHFIYLWNNRHPITGTIGSQKATFWRPRIPQQLFGYHPVGDCIYPHFDDINYKHMVPIVRDIEGAQGTALREPLSYEQVWDSEGFNTQNHKGSWNTSLWRPIPPPGYVAMGLVVGNGLEQPRTDAVRCLREDLVIESSIGDLIWSNRGSQADKDFSAWDITPPAALAGEVYFCANTFAGIGAYTKPNTMATAYALRVSMPVTATIPADAPQLTSHAEPSSLDSNTRTGFTELPWFTIKDPQLSAFEQVSQSPTYKVERTDRYILIGHGHNTAESPQRYNWSTTTGINSAAANTFSATTSIDIRAPWAVATHFKASAKLSAITTPQGWSEAKTLNIWSDIAPNTALAFYLVESRYRLLRKDGSQIGETLLYKDDQASYWTEYPQGNACKVGIKLNSSASRADQR